jgi:hypothetical protein
MQSVRFIEKSHQYFVDDIEYTSVTTLIEKYSQDFEEEFWSRYKAVELIFKQRYGDSKGIEYFQELKKQRSQHAPGWEEWMCQMEKIQVDEVDQAQADIIQMWRKENYDSLVKGSAYHNKREEEAYSKGFARNPMTGKTHVTAQRGVSSCNDLSHLMPGYYPELIIWNNEYQVIGTADRVFISSGTRSDTRKQVWIDDYKTNKEIKKQNMFQKMKYPLSKLDDCNYNHYRLQIGLYAWMLEQWGYNVRGISINHNTEDGPVLYKMRYSSIRPHVEAMLQHHSGYDMDSLKGALRYGFSAIHLLQQ